MVDTIDIKEHMDVIGADGLYVGKVDKVEGQRIKLTRDDGHGGKRDHHHFLSLGLVADIEDGKVRLSATAANALTLQEEESGKAVSGEPMVSAKDSAFAFGKDDGGKTETASKPGFASEPTTNYAPAPDKSGPDWQKIGLGAAALGVASAAAFGATKFVKAKKADGASAIPLEDDESYRLISSMKVEGTKVLDRNGVAIGTVQSMMIDKYSGRVAYAILSFGGTFGVGASLFPLPWAALEYDDTQSGYVLDLTKDQLAEAPKFAANDEPEFDAPYRQRVLLFYRAM